MLLLSSRRPNEYVAATFGPSQFPRRFHLGDGNSYGACVNRQLQSGTYSVYIVVVSQLFEVCLNDIVDTRMWTCQCAAVDSIDTQPLEIALDKHT